MLKPGGTVIGAPLSPSTASPSPFSSTPEAATRKSPRRE
jgi:hypothetical protein